MKGDKLLLHGRYKERAIDNVRKILPFVKNKIKAVVAIGGISGTLKSETTFYLQELLLLENNVKSFAISADDYYLIPHYERNENREQTGIIGPEEVDFDYINKIIYNFRTEESLRDIKEVNRFTDKCDKYKIIDITGVHVLIIEGLYSLKCLVDFRAYLEGSILGTKEFRKERGKEILTDFRKHVLKVEAEEVEKTKHLADIILGEKNDRS